MNSSRTQCQQGTGKILFLPDFTFLFISSKAPPHHIFIDIPVPRLNQRHYHLPPYKNNIRKQRLGQVRLNFHSIFTLFPISLLFPKSVKQLFPSLCEINIFTGLMCHNVWLSPECRWDWLTFRTNLLQQFNHLICCISFLWLSFNCSLHLDKNVNDFLSFYFLIFLRPLNSQGFTCFYLRHLYI